jgi:hypothetical protein
MWRIRHWFRVTCCRLGWHRHGHVYNPWSGEHNCLSCGATWFRKPTIAT